MKRYDFTSDDVCHSGCRIEEFDDGEWVKHDDHKAEMLLEIDANKTLRNEIRRLKTIRRNRIMERIIVKMYLGDVEISIKGIPEDVKAVAHRLPDFIRYGIIKSVDLCINDKRKEKPNNGR